MIWTHKGSAHKDLSDNNGKRKIACDFNQTQ